MHTYDAFARDFDRTRSRPWAPLLEFLKVVRTIEPDLDWGVVLDVGCGNGRHLGLSPSNANAKFAVGADTSVELLRIARERFGRRAGGRQPHLVCASGDSLPFRDGMFTAILCVAVLHHLRSHPLRGALVTEVSRALTPGGVLVGSVWRKWQGRFRDHFEDQLLARLTGERSPRDGGLGNGDALVPWKDSKTGDVHERFYHLFTAHELARLFREFGGHLRRCSVRLFGRGRRRDNVFFAYFKKDPRLSDTRRRGSRP
ncbi:MAG: class I SAM-dependent methyltransferase [Promethearchaeota archaeon]